MRPEMSGNVRLTLRWYFKSQEVRFLQAREIHAPLPEAESWHARLHSCCTIFALCSAAFLHRNSGLLQTCATERLFKTKESGLGLEKAENRSPRKSARRMNGCPASRTQGLVIPGQRSLMAGPLERLMCSVHVCLD